MINTPELLSSPKYYLTECYVEQKTGGEGGWGGGGEVSFLPVGETFEKKNSNTLKLFSADLSKKRHPANC